MKNFHFVLLALMLFAAHLSEAGRSSGSRSSSSGSRSSGSYGSGSRSSGSYSRGSSGGYSSSGSSASRSYSYTSAPRTSSYSYTSAPRISSYSYTSAPKTSFSHTQTSAPKIASTSYTNSNSAPKITSTSYTSSNSQPAKPIGWNVPQGPPPAYSQHNTIEATKTNIYEKPPSYSPSNQLPPAYPGIGTPAQPPLQYSSSNQQMPPSYYPAGTYAQSSSGPGFGTGLVAGGLGGAILGNALTPTHKEVIHHTSSNTNSDSGRVIIINNTPEQPAQVTTANEHQPNVVNNPTTFQSGFTAQSRYPAQSGHLVQSGSPVQSGFTDQAGEAPVPLAPFQPETTQSHPFPTVSPRSDIINSSDPTTAQQQVQTGGVYCTAVMVNVTSPTDSTNITQVEQISCYQLFAPPPQVQLNQQQPPAVNTSGQNHVTFGQRTSTATLSESSNIKYSGANSGKEISMLTAFTSTGFVILLAYYLQ